MREREKKQAEDESRHREPPIKNDSHDRTRQGMDRKNRVLEERKGNGFSLEKWRGKSQQKKYEQSITEAGREGEMGSQGATEIHLRTFTASIETCREKTSSEGENNAR